MFSFHKPKIYRSLTGCCICRAKSSSSRFTDSGKYEPYFAVCFHLEEERSGDICNACVLLVKRFRKLPAGLQRHWGHVVDARANAKTRPMATPRGPKAQLLLKASHHRGVDGDHDVHDVEDDLMDDDDDDDDDEDLIKMRASKQRRPNKRLRQAFAPRAPCGQPVPSSPTSPARLAASSATSATSMPAFLDPTLWRRETICCGTIYRGPMNAIVIDNRFFTPCPPSARRGSTDSTSGSSTSSGSASSTAASPVSSTDKMDDDGETSGSDGGGSGSGSASSASGYHVPAAL